MDDERIEHALRLGPVDEPAYRAGVRARIGSGASATTPDAPPARSTDDGPALTSPTTIDVRPRVGARTSPAPRLATLAQLAAVLAIVLVAATVALPGLIGGGPRTDDEGRSGDMLDRLRASGSIRLLVPDRAPQTVVTGGARIGFDIDVADAVAEELSVEPVVKPVDVDPNLPASAWDASVGMPSGGDAAGESQPYAYWPAWLATDAESGLTTIDAVEGHPICIVGSTVAEGWLQQISPGASAGSGPRVVRAQTDDECIAALAEGRVDALVTSTLFDDELGSRGLVAIGTVPVAWEPRVVRISATGEDPGGLLEAIDAAIDDLRTSGRLADLSRRSFGGRDLTEMQP